MKNKLLLLTFVSLLLSLSLLVSCSGGCGGTEESGSSESETPTESTPDVSRPSDTETVPEGEKFLFQYTEDGEGLILMMALQDLESVAVPAEYGGKPVVEIAPWAFSDCAELISVTLPDSVVAVGGSAFYGCAKLQSATLPAVTEIGEYAFYGCTALASVTLCADRPIALGKEIFGRTALWETAEDGILYVGRHLMDADASVTVATVKEGTLSLADGAFLGCEDLSEITLPASVGYLGSELFQGCHSLSRLTVLCPMERIPASMLSDCLALTEITLPEGLTVIETGAFSGCTYLKNVTLPSTLKEIGDEAFMACASLESLRLPEGLTVIGAQAFYGCSELRDVSVPSTVTEIGRDAFRATAMEANRENWTDGGLYIGTRLVAVDTEFRGTFTVKEGTTHIGEAAFFSADGVRAVVLPSSLRVIEDQAFLGLSALASVNIPEGVTSLGAFAFWGCSSLREITLPESVTLVGRRCFESCSSLASLTVPGEGWTVSKDGTLTLGGTDTPVDLSDPAQNAVIYSGKWK